MRLARAALATASVVLAVTLLSACASRPVASGVVGDGFPVVLDEAGTITLTLTVDEVVPVTADDARAWGLRLFSDEDGSEAATLDFLMVRFTVSDVEGPLEQVMVAAPTWSLMAGGAEYPGRFFVVPDAVGCDVSADGSGSSCVMLALPQGKAPTELRYANVDQGGSVRGGALADARYVSWMVA